MKGTREHIKEPNGQSSTMILCLTSNGRQENLANGNISFKKNIMSTKILYRKYKNLDMSQREIPKYY